MYSRVPLSLSRETLDTFDKEKVTEYHRRAARPRLLDTKYGVCTTRCTAVGPGSIQHNYLISRSMCDTRAAACYCG